MMRSRLTKRSWILMKEIDKQTKQILELQSTSESKAKIIQEVHTCVYIMFASSKMIHYAYCVCISHIPLYIAL